MHVLQKETQALVPLLTARQCQFAWRGEDMIASRNEPFEAGHCWFEIWMWGTLICFAGPFECPMSESTLKAAVSPVIEQAALLIELRSM